MEKETNKKNEKKGVNHTPILDIVLVILCAILIVLDLKTGNGGKLTGYCILGIALVIITWFPKFRSIFHK